MCGGITGIITWIAAFPIDVVKTQVMLNNSNEKLSMRQVFVKNYKMHGWPIFFKGLTPALIRAFPRHAVVLTVFDYVSF